MTNPETGEPICPGCNREWKGRSVYCPECQKHGVGSTESSLGGLIQTFKSGVIGNDGKPILGPCLRCKTPDTIVVNSAQGFCKTCMHEMSYNSYLGRYTDK